MLTKRGGFLLILGIFLELLGLSFYGFVSLNAFLRDTFGFDLSVFLPNIDKLTVFSPYFFFLGLLILVSFSLSLLNFLLILSSESITIERILDRTSCFAGDYILVTLKVRNNTPFQIDHLFLSDIIPDTVDLALGENFMSLSIAPNQSTEFSYIIRCAVRGKYKLGPIYIAVQDKAGLFLTERFLNIITEVTVYPPYEDVKKLEMLQKVYGSLLFGQHKVRIRGSGYDFWGLRRFQITDSIKFIDWKASARLGRLLVKEYEAEKNLRMYVFLDSSYTMGYGTQRNTKLDYSCRAAVLLTYLANRARDLFGLCVFSSRLNKFIPANRGRKHFLKILESLAVIESEGKFNLAATMRDFIVRERRFSLAIIISDLEGDITNIEEGIKIALAHKVFPIIIAPIGPLFEFEKFGDDPRTSGLKEALLAEYLERREKIRRKLATYRVLVIDVSPEDVLALTLETYLRSKARSLALI